MSQSPTTTLTDDTSVSTRRAARAGSLPKLSLLQKHHYLFFNPHHLHFEVDGRSVEWQSRRQRKHRYATAQYDLNHGSESVDAWLRIPSLKLEPHLKGDVSFWIAVAFTFGSIIWVVNGFLVWLPEIYPSVESEAVKKAAAALGFVGGTVFEVGSYLMVVEALDRGREHEFGSALGGLLRPGIRKRIEYAWSPNEKKRVASGDPWYHCREGAKGFVWWGRPQWRDMGYLAGIVQLCAATIFWVATITGLPGVIPGMASGHQVAVVDVFFWTPQVIGGCGFVLSSTILMLEVQHKWWKPRPFDIGWQVGFWNMIGGVGFLLCGAFGYAPTSGMVYQSGLSTFWGSWAFLIGSACQLSEVTVREVEPAPASEEARSPTHGFRGADASTQSGKS